MINIHDLIVLPVIAARGSGDNYLRRLLRSAGKEDAVASHWKYAG
jgi:hypothetical protein